MEECCTDTMTQQRCFFWVGDAIAYCAENLDTINNYWFDTLIKPLSLLLCNMYIENMKGLIGIRNACKREQRLSRFYNQLSYNKSTRVQNSAHIIMLVTTKENVTAQYMLSASPSQPTLVECIDVENVKCIRLSIWIVKQVQQMYNLSDDIFHVWSLCVTPKLFLHTKEFRLNNAPWKRSTAIFIPMSNSTK